ncbi:MAG: ribosome recycling factor [Candidatus Gracilibacteria bacterium]|nr:ribosome recycling factor [Candidatus Gracilibacteria bacterium]
MIGNIKTDLQKAEEHLHNEFNKLQVGRANPSLIEGVHVNVYGGIQPLKNVASVSVMDSQTLSIQPWDKSLIRDIDKAISDAGLGLNPQNNGETIMIKIPLLTEERRKDLVKIAKKLAEDGKIAIRNIRQDYLKKIKNAETNKEISEDISKQNEKDLQKYIDEEIENIEKMLKHKEEEIMKI